MTSCQLLSACFDYIIKRTYIINSASLLPAATTAVLFYGVRHNAPDVKTAFRGDENGVVKFVGRLEPHFARFEMQPFHSEVAVDAAHGQIAVLRLNGAVDDKNIALLYPLVNHRIAVDTAIEG